LLNPEVTTLLAGRYIEIKVQPLSFKEYLLFRQQENIEVKEAFDQYITYGGMLGAVQFLSKEESLKKYLSSICDTVLYRDVIQKNKVRDPHILEDVLHYGADNVGNILSTKKITDYLNSNGKKASFETVDKYLRMLEQAYIFTRARRFDIKGKAWFKTNDKYFLADTGLRNQLIGFRGKDYGHLLENIVFNELQLRSNTVAIGKYNDLEVDFVTIDFGQRKYYQVTTSMLDPNVAKRELKVLQAISDDYPKIILTLDEHNIGDFEGIKVINVIKWFKQCKVKALAS
jgi:predicted AAA+ superfamily ATPase